MSEADVHAVSAEKDTSLCCVRQKQVPSLETQSTHAHAYAQIYP